MSIILAVSRGHNASTTLMIDDEVIFYVEEERLSRWKHDGAPFLGMAKAFDYVDHIDHLVVCHTHKWGPDFDWTGEEIYHGWIRKLCRKKFQFETHFINLVHHKMHAACGFFNSGFETAACLIADGAGSFLDIGHESEPAYEFETIFKASYPCKFETVYKHIGTKVPLGEKVIFNERSNIGKFHEVIPTQNCMQFLTEYPGITKIYEAVTKYCGFDTIDAGKTMGLSPYGKDNPEIPDLFDKNDHGSYWGNRDVIVPTYPGGAEVNSGRYHILREDVTKHIPVQVNHLQGGRDIQESLNKQKNASDEGKYTQVQMDLAWKCQKQTEERMIELIQKAHEETGETNIVVSGGYGLNCVANYKFWKAFPNLKIHCEPISHDGGTTIGAAKYVYNYFAKNKQPLPPANSIYYGPKYDPDSYMEELDGREVTDTSYDDVAKLIREGNIVTIFQGRSEGGPRALGNRSILFDPTIKDGKDIVNSVKHREFFRPFACTIKKENVHEWFDLQGRDETPHMMYAVDALPGVAEKIPSVIHVDNTCRIQTVTQEQNEHYYNLISAFEKLSDTPILFNTSFNLGGDPLVETIEDAIDTLETSDIDWMYLPEIQKLVYVPKTRDTVRSVWMCGREFTSEQT